MLSRIVASPASVEPVLIVLLALALLGPICGCAPGDSADNEPSAEVAEEPVIERDPLRQAFFGDLHVHTAHSLDAYINGVRLGPRDAYGFARGAAVSLPGGTKQQLAMPLDFAAVTDHAEFFAEGVLCTDPSSQAFEADFCVALRGGDGSIIPSVFERMSRQPPDRDQQTCPEAESCRELAKGPWQDIQAAAAELNDPGRFTTFVAYEYSPLLRDFGTLHRNIIFRGATVPDEALSALDLPTQADLWRWLETACTGDCEVQAIPHNMNMSWGLLFSRTNDDGTPYSAEDLERRARFERVAEVTQLKGSSECAVGLGTNDEECAFEQMFPLCEEGQETKCAQSGSYLRDALLDGLALEEGGGTNPFKLGMIGSTDAHNGTAGAVEEDRFIGAEMPPAELFAAASPIYGSRTNINPGGLAGVWAESNTREDLFDALRRRESFATSGTRIRARFFAGWDYPSDLDKRENALRVAYEQGVPMGGDLGAPNGQTSPQFWVWALRGADGAPLDRLQVVKGWTATDGSPHHRVRDVACAGGRVPDPATGRCAAVEASVDLEDCSVRDDSGAGELSVVFADPDFDPKRPAFYYVRVLEVPSCRWTTHLANRAGLEPPSNRPSTIQERAWSSPIWYTPSFRK